MDKKRIDKLIPYAYKSLKKISNNGAIDKEYRGGISSFGAAVSMGSLESAAAFFSAENSSAHYDRRKLGMIVVETATEGKEENKSLYQYVEENKDCMNLVLDAAVAVKLAMNLYHLKSKEE